MGTRVAPIYANFFMDSLEQTYIYPHDNCPTIWFRFLMTFGVYLEELKKS